MALETEIHVQEDVKSTSWWENSTIFGSRACQSNAASMCETSSDKGCSLLPIGGAKAQSRFSGKTALPIFREEARDTEIKGCPGKGYKEVPRRIRERSVGYRCDGNPVVSTGTRFKHEWVFSFEEWAWRRNDENNLDVPRKSRSSSRKLQKGVQSHTKSVRSTIPEFCGSGGSKTIGGFEDVKLKLRENVYLPLKHREICRRIGMSPGRGVLVHGPSGCGKTHLLSSLGEEYGVYMETISCAECVGGDESENRMKRAFQNARNSSPSILFFDNFEVLAPHPGQQTHSNSLDGRAMHIFKSYLDALSNEKCDVVVICATSDIESVDPSLRRHGRLDLELFMGRPLSTNEKLDILRCCLCSMLCAPELNLESLRIEDHMQGFLVCDIAGIVREAGLHAVSDAIRASNSDENLLLLPENAPAITEEHIVSALKTVKIPSALREYSGAFQHSTSWNNIGGLEDAKKQLIEMIEWPILYGETINSFGLPLSSGALLYGAPGCGKTLLAKAVATSCKANFICINGPEVLQKWIGESEKSIREIFRVARLSKPCVVFIDELDALAPRRKNASAGKSAACDVTSRIVAQLLCEIDGVGNKTGNNHGVIVIGATNRPDAIDPALLRPGRLSEMIHVPLPDHQGRLSILDSKLQKCPKAVGFNLEDFAVKHADLLEGMSGADIAELARRATKVLIRSHIQGNADIDDAVLTNDILYGALKGIRKSVSQESVSYYNRLVNSLSSGQGFEDVQVPPTIPMNLAIKLTEQVVESRCSELRNRVQELEQVLHEHGIQID